MTDLRPDADDLAALLDQAADLAGPGTDLAGRAEALGRRRIARRRTTAVAALALAVTIGTALSLHPGRSALPPAVSPSASQQVNPPYAPTVAGPVLQRFADSQRQDPAGLAPRALLAAENGGYAFVARRRPAALGQGGRAVARRERTRLPEEVRAADGSVYQIPNSTIWPPD